MGEAMKIVGNYGKTTEMADIECELVVSKTRNHWQRFYLPIGFA